MDRSGFTFFVLCFAVGVPDSSGQNYVNVATGKTYSQISEHQVQGPSGNAANGNTDGVYSNSNCIHTNVKNLYPYPNANPWWKVDLGRTYPVYTIKVWARTGWVHRLYPFNITVDGQQCARVTSMSSRSQSVTCTSGVMYGQQVRLTRTGSDKPLNLCEFQILVPSGVSQCPAGRYGAQCNSQCSNNCGGGSGKNFCYQDTGYCYDGCQVGYYGDTCQLACSNLSPGCAQCSQDGQCTVCGNGFANPPPCTDCRDGYYKDNARCVQCNNNCAVSTICNKVTGKCNGCRVGYYGDKCLSECSILSPGCARCSQDGQCTACRDGFVNPPSCTDCQDGYYKRDAWCDRCSNNCAANTNCDKVTGKCNGCRDGRHGDTCSQTCSPSGQCQRCEQDTGTCLACYSSSNLEPPSCTECLDGYYKQYTSSTRCTECTWQCYNDTVCDKNTGNCNKCPPGKRGDKCRQPCQQGQYGQDCSERCGRCQNNVACDVVSGACDSCGQAGRQPPLCKTACENGTYGQNCGQTCGQCQDGAACDKVNGQCPLCVPGWYSPMCETPCHDGYYGVNCTEQCGTCLDGAVCNKTNGHCSSCPTGKQPPLCDTDCQGKTYGQNCKDLCGQCEGGQPCDTVTGECTGGCEPGYTGQNCQHECPRGHYGDRCNETCGHCLEKSACRHDTGQCETGCAEGFTGSLCVQAQVQDDPTGDVATAAGATVAAIVVVAAVVAVIIFIIRRRRGRKSDDYTDMPAEMLSGREGPTDPPDPTVTSGSPLSFAPAATGNTKAKPTVQVKPTVQSSGKPTVKAKPAQPAKSNGAIYENVTTLQQTINPKPSTSPSKPNSDKTQSSPNLNGVQNAEATTESKGKPLKRNKPSEGGASKIGLETPPEPLTGDDDAVYANEETYYITPTAIRLDTLQKMVVDKLRGGKLAEEFKRLIPSRDYPVTNGQRNENYYKNRFNSILPYDKNRVELEQVDNDDASDYINASFVKGHKTEKAYIAAQGPKVNTQDDFWRMVWQEKVTDIVILTNTMEGSKGKCFEYWPGEGATLNTGHMKVTGVEEELRAHFVIRTFDLKHVAGKEKRRVKQYHYLSWMDHEVPTTTPLVNFWRYVRARAPRSASAPPLVVHCSAGVGRTGTYIALDIAIDHTEQQEAEINLYDIVDKLREDRCHMVQNKSQYEFLHEAVLEAYTSRDTRMETAAFDSAFPNTLRHDAPNQRIDAQFETLMKMRNCLTQPTYTTATQKENRAKNRNPNALPDDKHLVFLTQHVKGRNQFINAVYMPTFEEARGSIVTQLPLADTLMDLWRLVDGCDCNTIVSVGKVDGEKDMCRYWPRDTEAIRTGSYTISLESMAKIGDCLYSYSVTMQRDDKSRAVHVLHYDGWTGEVADNTSDLIHLLTALQTSHKERAGKPVIVQCIDGASRSGLVCALWEIISRLMCDGEVDVYLAVRHVHNVRPEAIASVEQYRYCYEVVQQFNNSQSVYANA